MINQTVKTTVEIDQNLLYLVKMKALKEGKTLKELINGGLAREVGLVQKVKTRQNSKIGGRHLGGVRGNLRRAEIYDNF